MLKEFKMDLHVHTCLSPCAEPEMLPGAIVERAKSQNLDAVAICDHNSAENVPAAKKAGEKYGVRVFGGMEICSSEEVHILAFFDNDDALFEMQRIVYENLLGENDEKYFGSQQIADEYDNVVASCNKLLIGSTLLSVNEVVDSIHSLGGLAVASHIDRESFSIVGQLGLIPEGMPLDAVELSSRCKDHEIAGFSEYGYQIVRSSDAHFLSDIGKVATSFVLREPLVSELAMAFHGIDGRKVMI
jgi:PHP family Zn ribbon phosphoesterase